MSDREGATDDADNSLQSLFYFPAGTRCSGHADRIVRQLSARPFNPCWQSFARNNFVHRILNGHAYYISGLVFESGPEVLVPLFAELVVLGLRLGLLKIFDLTVFQFEFEPGRRLQTGLRRQSIFFLS